MGTKVYVQMIKVSLDINATVPLVTNLMDYTVKKVSCAVFDDVNNILYTLIKFKFNLCAASQTFTLQVGV